MAVERKFVAEGVRRARVEKHLVKELKRAGYGGMDLVRTPLGTQVTIFAEKPGIVIGKGGKLVRQPDPGPRDDLRCGITADRSATGPEPEFQCPDHG